MDFLTQKAAEQRKKLDAQKKSGKIPVLDSQSFSNVPLKAAPKLPLAKKAPMYTGRLSSMGMNLSADEYKESYGRLYDSPSEQRAAARTSAIGHSIVGGLASAFETGQQRAKDYSTNLKNMDKIAPYRDKVGELSAKRQKFLHVAAARGKEGAEKFLGYKFSDLEAELSAARASLDALVSNTVVDQNKYGQRMLEVSAQKQQEAKQGLGKVGSFLSDATIGIGSSIPGIATSVVAPAVGLPILGAQAAGQKSHELSARGIGSKEAWGRGVTSGLIEVGTEAVPIAKLAKLAKGIGGKQFIKGILEQSGTEATEESISYVANFLADKAARDPEAKFSASELAQSAAMGAISGGVLGGAASLGNRVMNGQPAPRLPQNRQTAAVSVAPVEQKPLGLPSPRIAVNPNGEAVVGHIAEGPRLPIRQRVEKTGETVLRNADEFDFKTLSDEQVQSVNSVIAAAQREKITPKEYIDRVAKPFDDVVEKAVVDLTADLQAYTPQGVSINQEVGVRQSNNDKWYSDAFKENGRAPNKAERAEIARRMVMDDVAAQRGQYVPQDVAQGYNLALAFREPLSKIDGDAVNVENVGGSTVVRRGRVRNEVIPDYSPVSARQIIQRVQEAATNGGVAQDVSALGGSERDGSLRDAVDFGKNTVGAAQHNPLSYSAMQNEYGAIPPGESPSRVVDAPKETPQGKTRRFARTMMESEAIPDSVIGDFEREIVNGTFAYSPMTDKAALAFADRTINDKGFNGALEHWDAVTKGKHMASKNDIVLGEVLLNQAANAGDAKLAMKLAAELAAEGTRAGQNVQALRLLKRMKPDGQLYYLQKTVQKVNADLLDKLKLKAPNVKIDEALADELLQAKNQQEIDVATDKIYQNIADQMPVSWIDKWNAWRYLSMLGNPRTHIRNIIGNGIFVPAVQLKNLIATPMEARLPQAERTKAVLTNKDAPLKDFARGDFANIKDAISSGGKLNPSDVIRDKQTIFKTKPLEWARKGNLNALEAEDAVFLKLHYTSAMAQVMKARGLTPDYLKSGSKEASKALEDARNYAIQEAQKATFRDASATANWLNKAKRSNKWGAVLGEGLFPFTKTPINILKRGVEYSPVGLISGVKSSLYDVKNGTKTASQAIDQMASGLTGTGVLALGAWLASMGLVSGGGSDDKKESLFDKLQGVQNYALKIGDYTYTLDWAAPSSLPLFVGVELYNVSQGVEKDVSLATILDSLTKISEPMVNMSMLKGINSLFKTAAYSKNPLSDAFFETIIGYFGQGVPTLAGQVARTVDDTRRTRFVDKNSGTLQVVQKFAQTQQAKLPFASKGLNPYVDTWGREEKNGNLLGRAAQNFISPGYISKKKSAELDAEISRLYKATGDSKVLPSGADKYIRFDGETKNFTPEEYVTYASEKGQVAYKNLDDLVDSAAYRGMSDEDKATAISSIYDYANAVAKTKVSSYVLPTDMQKVRDAESKGIKPSQYFVAKTAQKDVVGDSDGDGGTIDGTTKANKREAIDAVSGGLSDENKMLLYDSLNAGLAKKQAAGYETLKAKGMSESDFMKYLNITNSSKGLKNQKTGKTISGSLKNAQLKNLVDAGMSTAQAKYFMTVTLGSKW